MKVIIANFFSLSALQLANYVLPLITVPYIVRIIGADNYGLISWAAAGVTYFVLFVNFAFDYTATRDIGENRNNIAALSSICSTIFAAKILLFAVSSLIFIIALLCMPKLSQNMVLWIVSYGIVAGSVLFPTWFFQGMQELTKTAMLNFAIKLFFTFSVFILVRDRKDFIWIPMLLSVGQIAIGLIAAALLYWRYGIRLHSPRVSDVILALQRSSSMFVSTVTVSIYTISNTVLLGFLAPNNNVGYFSASSKLMYVVQGLFLVPIIQALYPHVGVMFQQSKEAGEKAIKSFFLIIMLCCSICSCLLYALSTFIIRWVFGVGFMPAVVTLKLLSPLPFVIGISQVTGVLGLLNLRKDKVVMIISIGASIFSLVTTYLLTSRFLETGTSIGWLMTELLVSTAGLLALKRAGINLFDLRETTVGLREAVHEGIKLLSNKTMAQLRKAVRP